MPNMWSPFSLGPLEALARLEEGNRRFLSGRAAGDGPAWPTFRAELAEVEQRPFAIVLGCSDSRTPVEILFDQGFGDLFVVRIAGNVVAPSVVGSIEFAAAQYGTRLVVVLGHTRCGAIGATLKAVASGEGPDSKNVRAITDRIAPHVAPLVHRGASPDDEQLQREAMRANVLASVDHLRHGSRLLEDLVLAQRLSIVGAEYELESGRVTFFEPPEHRERPLTTLGGDAGPKGPSAG